MRTTEFVVEQVLTGLLVLAVVALALPFDATTSCRLPEDANDLVAGAAVLTVAYLLGVVFDRFCDTLLARAEQVHRIRHASDLDARRSAIERSRSRDPFPEDRIRILVMEKGGALQDWMDYLRTRIRIVRSVVVFLPAITVVGASRLLYGDPLAEVAAVFCALVYGRVFLATVHLQASRETKVPRTDDSARDTFLADFEHANEPIFWGAAVLAIAVVLLLIAAAKASVPQSQLSPLAPVVTVVALGASVTALTVWSWWRITTTLLNFLTISAEILSKDHGE